MLLSALIVLSSFHAQLIMHVLLCSTRRRDEVKFFTWLHTNSYAYTLSPLQYAYYTLFRIIRWSLNIAVVQLSFYGL